MVDRALGISDAEKLFVLDNRLLLAVLLLAVIPCLDAVQKAYK